tara:strand:+ start:2647 stop:4527 length:1881 start_codon:yes stop_codon:yes gene_type:complete
MPTHAYTVVAVALLLPCVASFSAPSTSSTPSTNAAASVRSDVWNHDLHESGCDDPKQGRRVHIVLDGVAPGVAESDLAVLTVNGQNGLNLDTSDSADLTYLDWLRVHTNGASGSIWVSFHTRNVDWLGSTLKVHVEDKGGTVLYDGSVTPVAVESALTLSYVAFRKNGTEAVLHVHNADDGAAHTLDGATLDGKAVTLPAAATEPVPSGGHLVLTVPLSAAKGVNAVWTASLTSGGTAGFGGRVPSSERFVIEAWPKSTDCALPGGNDANAAEAASLGIDSMYTSWDGSCSSSVVSAIEKIAAGGAAWWHVMTDTSTAATLSASARRLVVDALLLGDEVDGKVDADHVRKGALKKALGAAAATPEVPTYQGSKTTRNVGTFAGITDIQGSDAYSAACAPTMLPVTKTLPLQYPYFYLRSARDNHAPGVFWGYSQFYSDAWGYQADAPELIAQIGQAVLSGSKALMLFQYSHEKMQGHKVDDLKAALAAVRAVGHVVREGDVGGVSFSTSATLNQQVMVETIRSPEQLLVAIVNTNADGYSNLLCHSDVSKHWTFKKYTIDTLTLHLSTAPDVATLSNWREPTGKDGELVPVSGVKVSVDGSQVKLEGIELDDDVPMRFLVADVGAQ